jgi:formate-dependent nitrite reductase membrane component NrfD
MNSLVHADIFFFVSTIAVVLVTILLIILFIFIVKILQDVRNFTRKARTEGEFWVYEMRNFRQSSRFSRFGLRVFLRLLRAIFSRYY